MITILIYIFSVCKKKIVGTGGIKGIVSPLCADQYRRTENYIKVLPSGERVLVDYDLSIQHLYNWLVIFSFVP
jgi:hypothetical protein